SYMVNVLFSGSFFPFCCENSTHPCDCWPGCGHDRCAAPLPHHLHHIDCVCVSVCW
ncbi:AGAP009501-PA, partial [Anopheles gambiae str. PEST]